MAISRPPFWDARHDCVPVYHRLRNTPDRISRTLWEERCLARHGDEDYLLRWAYDLGLQHSHNVVPATMRARLDDYLEKCGLVEVTPWFSTTFTVQLGLGYPRRGALCSIAGQGTRWAKCPTAAVSHISILKHHKTIGWMAERSKALHSSALVTSKLISLEHCSIVRCVGSNPTPLSSFFLSFC